MADPYVFEVEASTHDLLKQGVLAMQRIPGGPDFSVVVISSDEIPSEAEAELVACQIVACTSRGMPTASRLISWPIDREERA